MTVTPSISTTLMSSGMAKNCAPTVACWQGEPAKSLRQLRFDRLNHLIAHGLDRRAVTRHDRPVLPDQEFLKVPLNLARELRVGLLAGQVFVKRGLVTPLHIHLR